MAEQWGMSPARLATLVRLFVFVEGPHDHLVIQELLADELRSCGAVVMPLMGTKEVPLVAESEFIFASSEAPVLICLDNARSNY